MSLLSFQGWPTSVPLPQSEVVCVRLNPTKLWCGVLTQNRVSVWSVGQTQLIMLGSWVRTDLAETGRNCAMHWRDDSQRIVVVTDRLCVYLLNVVLLDKRPALSDRRSPEERSSSKMSGVSWILRESGAAEGGGGAPSRFPNLHFVQSRLDIQVCRLMYILKLPPQSRFSGLFSLTPNVFVICTNLGFFIHFDWSGDIQIITQLDLKHSSSNSTTSSSPSHSAAEPSEDPSEKSVLSQLTDRILAPQPQTDLSVTSKKRRPLSEGYEIKQVRFSRKLGVICTVFKNGVCWLIPIHKLSHEALAGSAAGRRSKSGSRSSHKKSEPTSQDSTSKSSRSRRSRKRDHKPVGLVAKTAKLEDCRGKVVCSDICERHHLLAVGLAPSDDDDPLYSSSVVVYKLIVRQKRRSLKFRKLRVFRKDAYRRGFDARFGLISEDASLDASKSDDGCSMGAIHSVQWSDGGSSIAVGYAHGIAVYSTRGVVLYSFDVRAKQKGFSPLVSLISPEQRNVVSNVQWLNKDYGLLWCAQPEHVAGSDRGSQSITSDATLMKMRCMKRGLGNLCSNDVSRLSMICCDGHCNQIWVWNPLSVMDDPECMDYWTHIEVDNTDYLCHGNWPIRELCISDGRSYVAISATRGFAVHSAHSGQWYSVRYIPREPGLFGPGTGTLLTTDSASSILGPTPLSPEDKTAIFVCVMCFFQQRYLFVANFEHKSIVVSSKDSKKGRQSTSRVKSVNEWQLLVFDVHKIVEHYRNFDLSSVQSDCFEPCIRYPLKSQPIGMEIVPVTLNRRASSSTAHHRSKHHHSDLEGKLLLYFIDGFVQIYDVIIPSDRSNSKSGSKLAPVSEELSERSGVAKSSGNESGMVKIENRGVFAPLPSLSSHPRMVRLWVPFDSRDGVECAQELEESEESEEDGNDHANEGYLSGLPVFIVILDGENQLSVLDPQASLAGLSPLPESGESASNKGGLIIGRQIHDVFVMKEVRSQLAVRHAPYFLWTAHATGLTRWKVKSLSGPKLSGLRVTSYFHQSTSDVSSGDDDSSLFLSGELTCVGLCNALSVSVHCQRKGSSNANTHFEVRSYLHASIRDCLYECGPDTAYDLMVSATTSGAWRHLYSLEYILKEALDCFCEDSKAEGTPELNMRRVLEFIQRWPMDYFSILANVSRKTDPVHWAAFFRFCGKPEDLIVAAIQAGLYSSAAKFLHILEKTDINLAMQYTGILIDHAIDHSADQLVFTLTNFAKKLRLIFTDCKRDNLEITHIPL